MSKYTAEQVLHAADLEQAKYDGDLIISGYLRDYAALLSEREAAKASVTDEIVTVARDAYIRIRSLNWECEDDTLAWRTSLEAVAPMLASIQSPDMVCEQHPWSEWPHDDCAGPGMPGTTQYEALVYLAKLASARVPEEWVRRLSAPVTAEELKRAWNMIGQAHPQKEWVERALIGFIELRLAAAPKPTNVWPVDAREKAFSLAREMLQKGSPKPETEE